MCSNRASKAIWIVIGALALPYTAAGQTPYVQRPRHFLTPFNDEAREVFNAGQLLYDQDNFAEAEKRFREVIQRFPRHAITDRAEYYLIRTLAQLGKRAEALSRINSFPKRYPRSKWSVDVEELSIKLTNQIPPAAETVLLQAPPASPAPVAPSLSPAASRTVAIRRRHTEAANSEISLQQEIMRAMFRSNVNRAFEIVTERLKSDMADPLVMSTLNMVATSASTQALPLLIEIAKNSPDAKARKDAIFWMSQSRGDKDSVVDALVQLSSSGIEDSDSINFALSQIRTEKAINALAAIAADNTKPDATRQNARFWLKSMRVPRANRTLENRLRNK